MQRLTAASLPLLALLAFGAARAQTGNPNPAMMPPGTPQTAPGIPAPHQPNQPDRLFAREAAIGGMAEVAFGKLAAQKGQDSAVKEFGRRMVDDHTKLNDRLSNLASADGIALPGSLDEEHRSMYEQLEKLNGAAFDRQYIQGQIADHQMTAQLLEYEIGSGQDADLKMFAADGLPVIFGHLQMAQTIDAQLAGKVLQAAAPPATAPSDRGSVTPKAPPGGTGKSPGAR